MPELSIVSQNSERDLRRSSARDQVDAAVTELTANLFRIARGAGKPERLIDHTIAYVKAAQEFFEAHGRWPTTELHQYLRIVETVEIDDARSRAWSGAEDQIISGAMQIAASRLVGQRAQEAAGSREMFEGFVVLEAQRAENRKGKGKR